ncbi:MAG: hypothetical protein CVT67_06420 [Actinobacteria bacterium HGW-Actinobacteria-7]|jgi:hypothetical protein|nr:MAG: hypothetical protein CVT67_06420 [Actinobacteria bacterium HGW-Actinobacteria-7]
MNVRDVLTNMRDAASQGGVFGIVLGVGVLVFILWLGFSIAYVWYLFSPRGRLDMLVQTKEAAHHNPWPRRVIVLAIVLLVPTVFQLGLNTKPACNSCHVATSKQLAKSPHKSTSCVRCHGATGVTAPVKNALDYARWGWTQSIRSRTVDSSQTANVSSRSCLSCHDSVAKGSVVAKGIRVSHKEFLGSSPCTTCHSDIGHAAGSESPGPKMSQCLPCHDGKTASATCAVCHVQDLAQAAAARSGETPSVKVKVTCVGACHEGSNCLRCHGTVMPHPEGWGPYLNPDDRAYWSGSHARAGFVNRDMCARCHYKKGQPLVPGDEGCSCHGLLGSMHGGKPWVKEHGLEATGQKAGELSSCFSCHSTTLCGFCHPNSYAKRYNPIAGPDSYQRDIPRSPQEQAIVDGL